MVTIAEEWVDTMSKMRVKIEFMPLMTRGGSLREPENAEVWQNTVDVFRKVAPQAEKAGVVLGVESNLDVDSYKRFLDAVGSPAVQAFYNPGGRAGGQVRRLQAIPDLGKDRVCAFT